MLMLSRSTTTDTSTTIDNTVFLISKLQAESEGPTKASKRGYPVIPRPYFRNPVT